MSRLTIVQGLRAPATEIGSKSQSFQEGQRFSLKLYGLDAIKLLWIDCDTSEA